MGSGRSSRDKGIIVSARLIPSFAGSNLTCLQGTLLAVAGTGSTGSRLSSGRLPASSTKNIVLFFSCPCFSPLILPVFGVGNSLPNCQNADSTAVLPPYFFLVLLFSISIISSSSSSSSSSSGVYLCVIVCVRARMFVCVCVCVCARARGRGTFH